MATEHIAATWPASCPAQGASSRGSSPISGAEASSTELSSSAHKVGSSRESQLSWPRTPLREGTWATTS